MFASKIRNSLDEFREDLDAFEQTVSEMIREKKTMLNQSTKSMVGLSAGKPSLSQTPIAIIGMASLFPQSENTQVYWENILNEVDCITEVPASRWNSSDYYDPNPRAVDKTYCKRGGFIPEIDFNPMEFGLPPNVLEATDISQLLALAVARQAMEDSGYGPAQLDVDYEKTGVVLGAVGRQLSGPLWGRLQYPIWERVLKSSGLSDEDTQKLIEKLKLAYPSWQENSFPGMLSNVISGRIANRFDFGGLNCTLDAACASSLAALKMAISELVEHRADMMLTGGVDPDNSAFTYLCFSKTPALSRKQESRPFDAESDGIMLGEGVGMVVLKRLEDAERDGDRIYAVIRGLGTSSDGRFKSIYAPRPEGQVKALRRAYADANIDPATVGLVEAHGTGTMAGDPAEFEGMKVVFAETQAEKQSIALGSVKAQIGHTKTAAGAASLIKAALALHHKVIPPTININQPSPKLGIEDSPFYLNTKLRPWMRREAQIPRRSGVSSFGFGGTNFHIVLEEYQSEHSAPYRIHSVPQSLLFAAADTAALTQRCQAVLSALQAEAGGDRAYADLAESCKTQVIPMTEARLGFVASSRADACAKLKVAINLLNQQKREAWEHPQGIYYRQSGLALQGKVVALFAGQGAQYLDMGQSLAVNFPEARQAYEPFDQLLRADGLDAISEVVYPRSVFDDASAEAQKRKLQRTEYAQPAIGAFSTGLYRIFQKAGFAPNFTAGHSFGELTALWAAGVLTDQDYAFLVKARGQAMAAPAGRDFDAGTMLAVKGDAAVIESIVNALEGVAIANFNSGQQVVLAGSTAAIAAAKTTLEARGFEPIPLRVSAAFHTPLVAHAQVPFSQAVDQVALGTPTTPIYTNVTGQVYPAEVGAMKTLLQRHMVSQVQFKQQIENIYAAGGVCFVEFGPKNTLTNLVKEILGDRPHLAIATNASRHKDSDLQLREAAMQLRVAGLSLADIDPYQLPIAVPAEPDERAKKLMVKISGASYVSEKTQNAFEAALQDGHQVKIAVSSSVPTIVSAVGSAVESGAIASPGVSPVAQKHGFLAEPPVTLEPGASHGASSPGVSSHGSLNGNGKTNGNGNGNGKTNGNGNGKANGNGSGNGKMVNGKTNGHAAQNLSIGQINGQPSVGQTQKATLPPPAQTDVAPITVMQNSAQSPHPALTSLENLLVQFTQHQNQILKVHEQYLDGHREYTQTFGQIAQQQQRLLTEAAGQQADLVASTDRNLAAFHGYQQETLRVHEQYLLQQMEFSKQLCGLGQQVCGGTVQSATTVQPVQPVQPAAPVAPVTPPPVAVAADPVVKAAPVPEVPVAKVIQPVVQPVVQPEPIPVPAPAPASRSNALALAPKLLEVVSDKTGYPVEMLELDMDMEADLGIDSIKRVEILGALQDAFPELPQPNLEELAEIELRTLGQVADYMQSKLKGEALAAAPIAAPMMTAPIAVTPVAATPMAVTSPVATSPVATTAAIAPTVASGVMQEKLLEVVSDKTGYPAEMLELDMDMEADLGIDSIKRVEILGALQEAFPELPQPNLEELAEIELRTLGQVADYMQAQLAKGKGNGSAPVTPAVVLPTAPGTASGTAPAPMATPAMSLGVPSQSIATPVSAPVPRPIAPVAAPALATAQASTTVALLDPPVVAPAGIPAVIPAVAPVPATAPASVSSVEMQTQLLEVVSDKTGYPAEMLELDMDMEADLGIDSIKRVEILGALQEAFPALPQPNLEELAEIELRTLGQVADYMQSQLAKGQVASGLVNSGLVNAGEAIAPLAVPSEPVVAIAPGEMQTQLLAVVSDKTGYPAEMLELDMDMEADLGIDSIKRVEILGALQEAFPELPQPNLEELAEIELRTLGQVADYMQARLQTGAEKKKQSSPTLNEGIQGGVTTWDIAALEAAVALDPLPLPRHPAQLQYLPPADWLDFELPSGHICLLTDDGSATTTQLAQQLTQRNWKVVVLSFPAGLVPQQAPLPQGVKRVVLEQLGDVALGQQLEAIATQEGSIAAFLHLHPTGFVQAGQGLSFSEAESSLVKQVFFLAKHLKAPLNQAATLGRSVFLSVARLDGAFGLSQQDPYSPIAAGLMGLTKTLNYEWRSVFCRAVDLNPALTPEQSVACILAELHDSDGLLPEAAYGQQGRVTLVAA